MPLTVRDLRVGDVLAHPEAKTNPTRWTVTGVQLIGTVAIVDFADGTATAPVAANGRIEIMTVPNEETR